MNFQTGYHIFETTLSIILFAMMAFIYYSIKKHHSNQIIKFKKLSDMATEPTRGSEQAAGYDLYACINEPMVINPGDTRKVPTGISVELPKGTFAGIYARSGLATKQGLRPANCVGVCDSDYRGEYIVAIHNDSDTLRTIEPGERIAQMIVSPYVSFAFQEVDNLSDTNRGDGGFGSTGK